MKTVDRGRDPGDARKLCGDRSKRCADGESRRWIPSQDQDRVRKGCTDPLHRKRESSSLRFVGRRSEAISFPGAEARASRGFSSSGRDGRTFDGGETFLPASLPFSGRVPFASRLPIRRRVRLLSKGVGQEIGEQADANPWMARRDPKRFRSSDSRTRFRRREDLPYPFGGFVRHAWTRDERRSSSRAPVRVPEFVPTPTFGRTNSPRGSCPPPSGGSVRLPWGRDEGVRIPSVRTVSVEGRRHVRSFRMCRNERGFASRQQRVFWEEHVRMAFRNEREEALRNS